MKMVWLVLVEVYLGNFWEVFELFRVVKAAEINVCLEQYLSTSTIVIFDAILVMKLYWNYACNILVHFVCRICRQHCQAWRGESKVTDNTGLFRQHRSTEICSTLLFRDQWKLLVHMGIFLCTNEYRVAGIFWRTKLWVGVVNGHLWCGCLLKFWVSITFCFLWC